MASDWKNAARAAGRDILVDVEVIPGAASPRFPVGYNPWRKRLQARVAAPARGGAANDELVRLVASTLQVEATRVAIDEGATSRRKRIRIRAYDLAALRATLGEALDGA